MKTTFTLALALFVIGSYAQITKGNHFFKLSGVKFSEEETQFDRYPIFTDTTGGDSVVYSGSNNNNIMLGYHIGLGDHFSIGVESRFLSSSESSYRINSVGPSIRYHFAIGQIGAKTAKESTSEKAHIEYIKSSNVARTFFFIDYTALFGSLNYENKREQYQNNLLQVGMALRIPLEIKVARAFGLELSGGMSYRKVPGGTYEAFPILSGGLHIYLDKKHLRFINPK